jgi:hypothetical protein
MTDYREVARRQVAQWLPVASVRALRLAGVLGSALFLTAGSVTAQETSLTIYQSGQALVRRTFPVAVPRGASTPSVDLGARAVDPGTLVALDDGVEIRGVTAVQGQGPEAALRRSVGREIAFMVMGGDSAVRFVRGTVLSLDPQAVRTAGGVIYGFPGTPAFPDSLIELAPRLAVTLEAARSRPSLRLAYQADGVQWRASYTLVVPRSARASGTMAGLATIDDPGGLSFNGAEVQLLAGDVRRAGYAAPRDFVASRAMAAVAAAPAPAPSEESVGETHVYTLPGSVDLVPGQSKSVALFAPASVQVEPEYVLRHPMYVYQSQQSQPEQDLHAQTGYLVRRAKGTPFGDVPLPAGAVRVLTPDSDGRLQLVGEPQIEHTPAGRELHLATGTAFDVTAQRVQLTFAMDGRRASVSSYRVTIQNAKSDTVTVQVLDEFPGQFEVLSSSVPAERLSSTSLRFPVRVPAGGEATLEYRVRARW